MSEGHFEAFFSRACASTFPNIKKITESKGSMGNGASLRLYVAERLQTRLSKPLCKRRLLLAFCCEIPPAQSTEKGEFFQEIFS